MCSHVYGAIAMALVYLFATNACGAANLACAGSQLALVEAMVDPIGRDADHEWFELQNFGDAPADLEGLTLTVESGRRHQRLTLLESITVPPHALWVAGNLERGHEAVPVQWGYGKAVTLPNRQAVITLSCGDAVLTTLRYGPDEGLMVTSGASLSFDGKQWCVSQRPPYDGQNRGTPGARNERCGKQTRRHGSMAARRSRAPGTGS